MYTYIYIVHIEKNSYQDNTGDPETLNPNSCASLLRAWVLLF